MTGSENYKVLIQKLDAFIRKYYVNKLIRGALYFVGFAVLLFLIFSIAEHNFYFSQAVRKVFFFGFIGLSLLSLVYWVAWPLFQYFKLGKTISHEQAAGIIGTHFGDVQDKLLNILQLKKQAETPGSSDLLIASIDQKAEDIRLVPFKNAIDLSTNKKYLKYALPPLVIFFALLLASPSLIKDSTFRIINNNQDFERAAPFKFLLEKQEFQVIQYQDFDLEVKIDGASLPNEVFIDVNDYQYKMKKVAADRFVYQFKNVQKDTPFKLYAGQVKTSFYTLNVLEKPNLLDFKMVLDYPSYTKSKDEVLQNIGDATVPVGTQIRWDFESDHTDTVHLKVAEKLHVAKQKSATKFSYSKRMMKSSAYQVYLSNQEIPFPDSFLYNIHVVPDQYPSISVEKAVDSVDNSIVFFVGSAADDYGVSKLAFTYVITNQNGQQKKKQSEQVPYDQRQRQVDFKHILNLQDLVLAPGDQVQYYFEVYDNDQIHGAKSTKSQIMTFKKKSLEELRDLEKQTSAEIKKELDEAMKETKDLREAFKKLREKLLQKKDMDWQTKKELEKLLEKQQEIQEKMERAKQKFQENKESNPEKSPELKEKEEKMEKMLEKMENDPIKDLMEKIQELMQDMKKDEALDKIEQMEAQDQEMEMKLERLQELYKQLEVEKEMERMMDELEKLGDQEEKLADETKKGEKSNEELKKEQEKIEEKFDELKKDMKALEKKNEQLKRPKDLGENNEEQMDDISQDMDDAQQNMDQNAKDKAAKSQKKAGQKMKQMAADMQAAAQGSEDDSIEEDIKLIRQILENVIRLSFDQEDLVEDFALTNTETPKYVSLIQDQFRIKDDFKIVEDSLHAMAQRQDKLEEFIMETVSGIKKNLGKSIKRLEDRKKIVANETQRKTMTGLNDLALMLDESMQNMQQQMSQSMPGSQMCNKPGGKGQGSPSKSGEPKDKISKGQEGMQKTLDKMMQGKKEGQGGSAKDFAKAAAQQAALRKALEDAMKEKQEQGKGASQEMQEIINQMNKIETDLVNKRLDYETMKRQKDIMTRLLKAEKADRKQDKDNKRKAENALKKQPKFPPNLDAYLKKRQAEIDAYKTVSPALKPYYKQLVESYYRTLKTKKN